MSSFTVWLARPRGFCRGVERAVKIAELAAPCYIKHAIVHNRHVIKELEGSGTVFVENISDIPNESLVVFSAHGSPFHDFEEARERNIRVIDAACPLVKKVHREINYYAARGYFVIYIGHRGHAEQIGAFGCAGPEQITLVETEEDALGVSPPQQEYLVVATQTTLSIAYTRHIIHDILLARFPRLVVPSVADICYATFNRQETVKALAKHVDLIIVVGSPESSNSRGLKYTAELAGTRACQIDSARELTPSLLNGVNNLGLVSGASTPEILVIETIEALRSFGAAEVKDFSILREDIAPFSLPHELLRN